MRANKYFNKHDIGQQQQQSSVKAAKRQQGIQYEGLL